MVEVEPHFFITVRKFGGLVVNVINGISILATKQLGKLKYLCDNLKKLSLFCLISDEKAGFSKKWLKSWWGNRRTVRTGHPACS